MFMVLSSWQCHCESSPGSLDKCRMAPSGHRPKTKPDDLGCESASACTGCQSLHSPLPFIIITQPESWYLFYHSAEGRRLSRRGWLVTYRDGLPAYRRSPILVLTGSDAVQLRYVLPLCQTANCGIWCQMFMWLRSTQVDSCIMPRMHSPNMLVEQSTYSSVASVTKLDDWLGNTFVLTVWNTETISSRLC